MRTRLLPLLLAALLTNTALAAETKETLKLAPYPADRPWQEVTNTSNGDQWLREQIPADQKIEAYKDILTAQSFPQQKNIDSAVFLKSLFSQIGAACERARVNGPKAQVEGGYPVAYAQVYCSKQKGAEFGVNMLFKVIKGADALYVVQREFRVPPSQTAGVTSFTKDQMEQMMALMQNMSIADSYLVKSVYLCGQQATDTRCASR